MDNLQIPATRSTPEISFNADTGVLLMSGESYPENSFEFYQPVIAWLKRFLSRSGCQATLVVQLAYLNTGSTKVMMDILDQLEDAHSNGRDARIEWHCERDNERALETAEEFREEVSLPFSIVMVES
jgi:SiaC family regulatory phosphoprotein